MSLAASLRSTAQRLIRQYGESASLTRTTLTGSSTGTTSASTVTYTFTAALIRRGKSLEQPSGSAPLRQFSSGGGRVLAGDEEAMIAALDLAVEPKPGDGFLWGSTTRRVVDLDTYRVQGSDIAYRVGLVA